jgi:hypothetical protein
VLWHVSGVVSPDVGSVGLLVGWVGLCKLVPSGRGGSTWGALVLFEHFVDKELGGHTVDRSLLDLCIGIDLGGFYYVVDYGFGQPLHEVSDCGGCCEWVFGLLGNSFEVLDVLVDVRPFHLHTFNMEACSFLCLHVLELLPELEQEVCSYIRDVFNEWVQLVYPIPLVEGPFVYCWAFDKCEGYRYAANPGLEAGDCGVYAEVVS